MEWQDNFLIIYFSQSKRDQEGMNNNDLYYINSNLTCPEISPVINLFKYFLSYPKMFQRYCHLYTGEYQYNFSMIFFCDFTKEHSDEFILLKVNLSGLVSQSYHKGADTLYTSGCTFTLTITSTGKEDTYIMIYPEISFVVRR